MTVFRDYLIWGWNRIVVGEYAADGVSMSDGSRAPLQLDRHGQLRISGQSVEVTATLTLQTAAYGAGNVMGGVIAFPNALRAPSLSGVLSSVRISDQKANADLRELWLFSEDPAGSTFTDRSAPLVAAVDIPKIVGRFPLAAPSSALGAHAHYAVDGIGKIVQSAGTSLYGVLLTLGAPTPATAADISVTIGLVQD